jgi:excisionase family DNA binding protein
MSSSKSIEDHVRRMTPVAATRRQKAAVVVLSAALTEIARGRLRCELVSGPTGKCVAIPDTVFHLLARVVEVLARGDAVSVVPIERNVTTQQAAELNVSRQYLVRLLDEGRMPSTKTGKHRRVRVADVLRFKVKRDDARADALDELTSMTEDLGGYRELK